MTDVAPPLIGNARAVAAVQRAFASGSPPHAWLFVGPEGVGKATLARWLAQAVNCETGAAEPCGECGRCLRIARGIHADVVTVSIPVAEKDEPQHKDISVEQVREVEAAVALAPFEGRTRVVMIDPADEMSGQAQNAFLKTLEEPPPYAVFVLIATREEALLQTVRSRCRKVEFTLVAAGEIEVALGALTPGPSSYGGLPSPVRGRGEKTDEREREDAQGWGPEPQEEDGRGEGTDGGESGERPVVDAERARLLARLAGGRPGRALALAKEPSLIEKRREVLEQARGLGSMRMGDLMDLGEKLADVFKRDREAVLGRLEEWLGWWRDLVLVQSGAEDGVANVDVLDGLREDAGRYAPGDVIGFVQALRECRRRLESNVQGRIALDAMLVRAARVATRARS